jgi:hypothetical protein
VAKCKYCGREMLSAAGCAFTTLRIGDEWMKRIRADNPGGRCGDCGARHKMQHHIGCDMEICPKCGHQLISCDCYGSDLQFGIIA